MNGFAGDKAHKHAKQVRILVAKLDTLLFLR